jgi:hypothetical protein
VSYAWGAALFVVVFLGVGVAVTLLLFQTRPRLAVGGYDVTV